MKGVIQKFVEAQQAVSRLEERFTRMENYLPKLELRLMDRAGRLSADDEDYMELLRAKGFDYSYSVSGVNFNAHDPFPFPPLHGHGDKTIGARGYAAGTGTGRSRGRSLEQVTDYADSEIDDAELRRRLGLYPDSDSSRGGSQMF